MLRIIAFFFKSSWQKIIITSLVSAFAAGLNILNIKLLNDLITGSNSSPFFILGQIIGLVAVSSTMTYFTGIAITKHFELRIADYRRDLAKRLVKAHTQAMVHPPSLHP